MVTPSFTCQNPNHHHHRSHFAGYRYPVEDTVVEESTASSIVTVISAASSSTARLNDSTTTPDIILTKHSTNSDFDLNSNVDDETLSTMATRSLSIKSKKMHKMDEAAASTEQITSSSTNLSHTTEAGTDQTKKKKNTANNTF